MCACSFIVHQLRRIFIEVPAIYVGYILAADINCRSSPKYKLQSALGHFRALGYQERLSNQSGVELECSLCQGYEHVHYII